MSHKLRVAMIIQAYHPVIGGAERQLGTIAPLLKDRGLDIHILTRRYKGLSAFEMIDGIPVHRLPIPGPMPMASFIFTLSGILMLRKINPDVIHAHELLSPTTTAVGAKLLFGYPVVAKVLGGGAMGDISKLKRNLISGIRVKMILKEVNRFITVSREIGSELAESGIPFEKLVSIPNGVNLARFQPVDIIKKEKLEKELDLPKGIKCIYTGRLDEEKNVLALVTAWKNIRGKFPQASLLIIGAGAEGKEIAQTASEGVFLLGKKIDVGPYLQASDVFILPSKREGLSNALLEAMACGLPVVATNVGGNSELVQDGINGLLVPSGDLDLLELAVLKLLGDKSLRNLLGQKAHDFVSENYKIEKTIDQLLNLYVEVRRS
ncbi:MAG: glycosyltransferase family 4 protein [Anaerolineaceae bacterium]